MGKMISCEECKNEISIKAKKCPNCGAKNKVRSRKRLVIWSIIIGIVLFLAVIGGGSTESFDETVYSVGDTITINEELEISVSLVERRHSVGSFLFTSTPASDAIYLCVKWGFKNIGDTPLNAFNQPSITLVDPNGNNYDEDIDGRLGYFEMNNFDDKVLSDLTPGLSVVTGSVFEVSQELLNAEGWTLEVEGRTINF